MFRAADHILLTKSDLLPVLDDFDPERARACVRELATPAAMQAVSVKNGEGVNEWLDWLRAEFAAQSERVARGESARPAVQPDGAHLHAEAPAAR
jgi:hydrogenase nickel incorporation protein HypB